MTYYRNVLEQSLPARLQSQRLLHRKTKQTSQTATEITVESKKNPRLLHVLTLVHRVARACHVLRNHSVVDAE